MLFFLLDTLRDSPARLLSVLPVFLLTVVASLVLGLTVHEFAHALAAHVQGDDTAKRAGRLSLNPLRHLDPAGAFMLVVVGIGWGKPVPVDPSALPHARRSMAWVALAGPLSNLALAGLLAVPFQLGLLDFYSPLFGLPGGLGSPDMVPAMLAYGIFFNLLLGVFNLLPLPPLDGSKVLIGLAPEGISMSLARLEQYGAFVLLGIFALDWFTDANLFWRAIQGPADFLGSLFVGQPFL